MEAINLVNSTNVAIKIEYQPDNYTLRMLKSIESTIVFESQQHRINGYDPDDVAQELRMHLFNKIHLYDPTKNANFKTWAMKVIHNRIINLNNLRSDYLDPNNFHNVFSIYDLVDEL